MLTIKIPSSFVKERSYVVHVLFNEFLGLKTKIEIDHKVQDYHIILANNNKLIVKDHFFGKFDDGLSYLDEINIPEQIQYCNNRYILEKDLPIIFGKKKTDSHKHIIITEIDVFSSCFFMLTRWEEYVIKITDKHNRFPAEESLAVKNGFLLRPIVNEYIEMTWNMLLALGSKQKRRRKEFELILTHDVDIPYYWKNKKVNLFRLLIADLIKRRSLIIFTKRIIEYIKVKCKIINDPYDNFNWIMKMSEENGLKSRFYFMSGGDTNFDSNYKLESVRDLINNIKLRGHIIGFEEKWRNEKKKLIKFINNDINEGRQHYLRFSIPNTWRIWESNKINIDSSCGYTSKSGFKCGTGDCYSVYDFLERKQLNIKERPLVIMDRSVINGLSYDIKEAEELVTSLLKISMKYNSTITVLFHNSTLNNNRIRSLYLGILDIYISLIKG